MKVENIPTDGTTALAPRMSEKQVRERMNQIADPSVADELYSLGQSMANEIVGSIRSLESKATLFAAYGTAIVTLLISSSGTWNRVGNHVTPWISVCAGMAAFLCTVCSVKALALKTYKIVSQEEWLEADCLQSYLKLRKYHILAIWSAMDSRFDVQSQKIRELRVAQRWLQVAVALMVLLLFQIAFVNYRLAQALRGGIGNVLGMQWWQLIHGHNFALGGLASSLILGFSFVVFGRYRSGF